MKETLINLELSKLAKDVGFNVECAYKYESKLRTEWDDIIEELDNYNLCCDRDYGIYAIQVKNWNAFDKEIYSAPTLNFLQKWLREERLIEITVYPIFGEKSGYDAFKREGYSFTILEINNPQHLSYIDFNLFLKDRNDEDVIELVEKVYDTYDKALQAGLIKALNLLKTMKFKIKNE